MTVRCICAIKITGILLIIFKYLSVTLILKNLIKIKNLLNKLFKQLNIVINYE